MIRSIKIGGFRALSSVSIEFHRDGHPIVLIGPNGSGKTSVLEAVDILSRASQDRGLRQSIAERGGIDRVLTAGAQLPLSFAVEFDAIEGTPFERDGGPVCYGFELERERSEFIVSSEYLEIYKHGMDNKPLRVLRRKRGAATTLNDSTKEQDHIDLGEDELALAAVRQSNLYPTLANVRNALDASALYTTLYTIPIWARDPREPNIGPRESVHISRESRLDRRGIDLVNLLYNFREERPDDWKSLMRDFTAEFPTVHRLDFPVDVSAGRIAMRYHDERYPSVPFFADQMSDGMLSLLSLLAVAYTATEHSIVAIDEPENHLHPSALRRVVAAIERASERASFIVATHSDRFLDHLSEPAKSVRCCTVRRGRVELAELNEEALEKWLESYTMSELRQRGHLDNRNDAHEVVE